MSQQSQETIFNDPKNHDIVLLFPQLLSDPIKYYAHSSILSSYHYFSSLIDNYASYQQEIQAILGANNSSNSNSKTATENNEKKEHHSDDNDDDNNMMITTSDENNNQSTSSVKNIKLDIKVYNREAFEYVMMYLYGEEDREHHLDFLDNTIDVIRLSILMGIPKLTTSVLNKIHDSDYTQHFFKLYYLAKTFAVTEMETKLKSKALTWKLSMYINYFDETMMLGFIEEYIEEKVSFGEIRLLEFALYWMKNNISDSNVAKLRELLVPLSVKLTSTMKTKHQIALKTIGEFGSDPTKLSDEMFLFMYNSLVSSIELLL